MNLAFTKMHGLGNDFVIVDARRDAPSLGRDTIRAMADRHTGVGFDQLLTIEAARDGTSAFGYGIWNADGEAVGQCGNGVRCIAAWLHRAGVLARDVDVRLQSPSGAVGVRLLDAATVTVAMGEPEFEPARIPFDADAVQPTYALAVAGQSLSIGAVSVGNPHAVVQVDDLDDAHIARLGPALSVHARFAEGCNAGFVRVRSRGAIDLRVHERGSGWTRACGTGACAAVAVLRRAGSVDARVAVQLPGGTLIIEWDGPGTPLAMTGPAAFVFEGQWPLKPAA